MATTGRPPVPIEVKRRVGTLRPERLINTPLPMGQSSEPPEPPEGLGDKGNDFWLLVHSAGRWISHTTDRTLVTITAELIEEREQLRALVIENPENTRLRSGLRDLEKALTSNLALMGFTPADRSRLGFAEVKAESKLEELMRRAEQRRGIQKPE
jgi:hypothetical protein